MSPTSTSPLRVAFDSQQIAQGIDALARAILRKHPDPRALGLVGVHSGGDLLVRRVEAAIARLGKLAGLQLDKGLLDMSFYRDDWLRLTQMPSLRNTDIPFSVEGRDLVLIDDVIFTGRTVRASLDAIFSLGRPARVELAVLVDRGHREFPIAPDYLGLTLRTQPHQAVNVFLFDNPSQDHATLEDQKYQLAPPIRAAS